MADNSKYDSSAQVIGGTRETNRDNIRAVDVDAHHRLLVADKDVAAALGSPAQTGEAAAAAATLRTTTLAGITTKNVTNTSKTLAALGVTVDANIKRLTVHNQGTGPITVAVGTAVAGAGIVIPAWGSKSFDYNAASLATLEFISGGSESVAFEQGK